MELLAATLAASALVPSSQIWLNYSLRVVNERLAATPAANDVAPSSPMLFR